MSAYGPSILPIPSSGVFGLKNTTEQGPVDGPRLDGFGTVGAVAVHAFLADVQLPASKIGRCGYHGVWVWLVRLEADGLCGQTSQINELGVMLIQDTCQPNWTKYKPVQKSFL